MRFRPMTPERVCVFIPLLNCVFVWYETSLEMCFFSYFSAFSCKPERKTPMYFSSVLLQSQKRVCVLKLLSPPREYTYVFLPQTFMSRKKQTRLSATFYLSSRTFWYPAMGRQCLQCWLMPLLRVQKQWTLHIHDHVWADKSKRSLAQISTCKSKEYGEVVKSIGTVCAKLVETNSSACAMFVVSASNYIYILFFAPCMPSGKMMKSRDFKLLLKKRLKPRLFLQLKMQN